MWHCLRSLDQYGNICIGFGYRLFFQLMHTCICLPLLQQQYYFRCLVIYFLSYFTFATVPVISACTYHIYLITLSCLLVGTAGLQRLAVPTKKYVYIFLILYFLQVRLRIRTVHEVAIRQLCSPGSNFEIQFYFLCFRPLLFSYHSYSNCGFMLLSTFHIVSFQFGFQYQYLLTG